MITVKRIMLPVLMAAVLTGCSKKEELALNDPLLVNRDTTVSPAQDFFHYINGGWFKKNPIPDNERGNGIFMIIRDTINAQVKNICEKSAANKNSAKGSNEQKIGDFYSSGMDTVAVDKQGLKPLDAMMSRIDAIADLPSLVTAIGYLHTMGSNPAFDFYVGQDDKISSKYALSFSQGGLGLGNRDYYFNTDKETTTIRVEYVKHLEAIFLLAGSNAATAKADAASVMKMETEFAKSSRKLEALRDPVKNYNKMTVAEFKAITPNADWQAILPSLGIAKADTLIVRQPEFFATFNKMLKSYTVPQWKTYLKWSTINSYASYLGKDIEKQNFHFYGTIVTGVAKQKPRWKRVVEQTNSSLGELIGQIYVKDYLPAGSKEKLLEIGNNIKDVYAGHIKKLDWMSEPTKQKALLKLSKIIMKVGYPDKWKDMNSVTIGRTSYCANVLAVNKWKYHFMVTKFGKPVDRNEWNMYPQTYNAYYDPSNNEIVVPACNILVPGFTGMPDDAVLYGIIGGSTFGHEITHGFDDQGSQFDEKGNLNDWWTAEDKAKFVQKTKRIVSQFNKFEVLPGKFVNGDATQGENIADLGGVVMGIEAFKKTPQFKNNEKISGFSPMERYFMAYGYAWMLNMKKEVLLQQIMTDVHSPAQYRINGPLANIPEFYQTFNIKPGDKMYQPDSLRVAIW